VICPLCDKRSKVIESRPVDDGASVRRRRECSSCGYRFTSFERYADAPALVRKRDQSVQAFDPDKLRAGLARAAHKRPDAEAAIEAIAGRAEAEARGAGEISSRRLGELCLEGLLESDRIAYLRFATVHKQLADLDALSAELSDLAIPADFDPEVLSTEGPDSQDLSIQPSRREVHA
jgi:transcriptional repressor NrdR